MRWRGTTHLPIEQILQGWDGESQVLVFDPCTGDTHLLSALAGLLLELLEHQALGFDVLLRRIRPSFESGSPEASDLPGLLDQHLSRLTRLGLLAELPS